MHIIVITKYNDKFPTCIPEVIGSNLRRGHRLFQLRLFMVFLGPCRLMQGQYLSHHRFLYILLKLLITDDRQFDTQSEQLAASLSEP
jgi:hypothetical protein